MKKMMTIKTSRTVLSVLLTVIFSISVLTALFSFVFSSTLFSKSFLERHFITDSLVEECEKQLEAGFEVLSDESGIPSAVFSVAYQEFPTKDSMLQAAQYIFNEQDSTLYSQSKIDYFYKICTEYLDGTGTKYKKSDIVNVAQKAAEIYSNCIGIHNVDSVNTQLPVFNKSCGKVITFAVIICVIIGAFLLMMYSDKNRAFAYLASGTAGAGIAGALSSAFLILFKVGNSFNYTPYIYQQSVYSMLRLSFVLMIACSLLITLVAYGVLFMIKKKQDKSYTFRTL